MNGADGQVCELDLIFNFQKAYSILDELIIAGELQESSKKAVLRIVSFPAPSNVPIGPESSFDVCMRTDSTT